MEPYEFQKALTRPCGGALDGFGAAADDASAPQLLVALGPQSEALGLQPPAMFCLPVLHQASIR